MDKLQSAQGWTIYRCSEKDCIAISRCHGRMEILQHYHCTSVYPCISCKKNFCSKHQWRIFDLSRKCVYCIFKAVKGK